MFLDVDVEDDNINSEDDEDHQKKHEENLEQQEEVEEVRDFYYGSTPMIQDEKGVIYYITTYEGQCTIMEINPKNDEIHENIFEIKSDECNGFSYHNGYFYFMDD